MVYTMKRKRKLILSILIFIILLIATFFSVWYPKKDDTYKDVIEKGEASNINDIKIDSSNEEINQDIENNSEYQNELPSYRSNYKNDNIVAKIKIPSIGLDSLITRTGNNKYYLNHDLFNNYSDLGTPFADYRNKDLYNNMQVNIYGHNTENPKYLDRLPFSKLSNYSDSNFYNTNKDVYLDIDQAEIHYRVIATKIINNSDSEHMILSYASENDWYNHVEKLLSNTLYKDNVEINHKDKLLVLQACYYNPRNSYILVICKKV